MQVDTPNNEEGDDASVADSASKADDANTEPIAETMEDKADESSEDEAETQATERPLNVRDALIYLDEVKKQFQDRPEVYNRFLDIMKEFKSQAIDTPGVIERVSALFEGRGQLIQGFNAFLPNGYHIECDMETGAIHVITPSGVNVISQQANLTFGPASAGGYGQEGEGNAMHSSHSVTSSAPAGGEPTEFRHAISFVNKIKNRFQGEPEVYKQFLEILQQYQKDGKPLQDVYAQVQVLFQDADDLLVEFKQFLPDPNAANASGSMGRSMLGALPGLHSFQTPGSTGNYPMDTGYDVGPAAKKKRMSNVGVETKTKRNRMSSPPLGRLSASQGNQKTPASNEELAFFEDVKRHIGVKQTYNEFLKVLNLFSQEILDRKQLIERVEPFIGNKRELFEWFKRFVKWDGSDEILENLPLSDTEEDRPRVDIEKCKKFGPSYRLLPPTERNLKCSGRDALCYEVLNDKWVSHPTWDSETSGFLAHRKNAFEEQMYRCEEERYDYDMNIQANLDLIALLEPVQKQLEGMSSEEKARMTLPEGLGGRSKILYKRALRKIYAEQAHQVIEQLEQNPATSVPLVLRRLKQKDEEWRKLQREQNRLWRELEARNYYKALDRRGINFKNNDKRSTNPRMLIAEIEALHRERPLVVPGTINQTFRLSDTMNEVTSPVTPPKPQNTHDHYVFEMNDAALHQDVFQIIKSWTEKQVASTSDRMLILGWFDEFVSAFFELNDGPPLVNGNHMNGNHMDVDPPLLQHLSPTHAALSRHAMEAHATSEDKQKDTLKWMHVVGESAAAEQSYLDKQVGRPHHGVLGKCPLYGNGAFYVFFRLYQLLYARLEALKSVSARATASHPLKHPNAIAVDLALRHKLTPLTEYDLEQDDYYQIFLSLVDRYFDMNTDDVDQNMFEECARYLFSTEAYISFTLDKLTQALAKQAQTIASDEVCLALYKLYQERLTGLQAEALHDMNTPMTLSQKRKKGMNTWRKQIAYRVDGEALVGGDDRLYKIEYVPLDHTLRIQLLTRGGDTTEEDTVAQEERWARYIENFVQLAPTEPGLASRTAPFLKRNLPAQLPDEPVANGIALNGLEIKICVNTYKMFFVEGSGDLFAKLQRVDAKLRQRSVKKQGKWRTWFNALSPHTSDFDQRLNAHLDDLDGWTSTATIQANGTTTWTSIQDL